VVLSIRYLLPVKCVGKGCSSLQKKVEMKEKCKTRRDPSLHFFLFVLLATVAVGQARLTVQLQGVVTWCQVGEWHVFGQTSPTPLPHLKRDLVTDAAPRTSGP
jgi:hypothetical protein